MTKRYAASFVLLAVSLTGSAQVAPDKPTQSSPAQAPAATQTQAPPDANPTAQVRKPDKAAAYYHYSMAHVYEELVTMYGRTEFASKAIEEYRLAIENDPESDYLNAGLAELYAKTGRIRDAVLEAQDIIKRDPNNLDARKLLGRIYLRSLGDMQSGTQSQEILKRAIEQYEAIVRIDPKSVDDHLLLGRLYRLNNDMLKAEQEFKTAVQLDPTSEDAVTTLSYLYNEQGDTNRAASILTSVPDAERSAKLYAALGYTYEQAKDYKKAVDAYRKAVELDKDNLDAMRGLAQNMMNDGQTDAALQQYKQIVDADPQDPQSYMRMAEIYRRSGKFDQALDSLKKAEAYVQDSLEVPYNMAVIYQAQGKFDESINILSGLVQKSEKPNNNYTPGERNNRAVFLERLGNIYRDTGKHDLALDVFRKMLTLGDENAARGYQEIIETHRDAKNWAKATEAAREAVAKLPNDRGMKLVLAGQLADVGQSEQALSQARSLLQGTPEDREVYLALGQINSRLKRWKEAEEDINKALQLSAKPEEKSYVNFLLASVYERQKKFDAAEQLFKQRLASDPNDAMVLNYLGYMLADRGVRLQEALGYLKRAVQLDPQNGAYLDSIGWAYFKLGNYELAEDNLRRASERAQNDPTIQDHLGELYVKTGRLKLATAAWERALVEWSRSVPADVDQNDVAKVQKKLESAKIRLARQNERKSAQATKPD
ncbi:MAG TPA: tetratricopeptide repeat protein [Terriglobales bacterium]|nr:tetratricopeptide repeat protein [Terriglobales bacterium]